METEAAPTPLRIGILGAARIAPMALIRPARSCPEVTIYGIAARVPARAGQFQLKHGITKAYPSYEAMLRADDVDAIYNPLPNGLHCEWTIRSLEAGKHVLCEKPFASNAAEAERMAAAAEHTGKKLMEAFHYRYHPLAARLREVIDGGELGAIRHIETSMCIPLPFFNDIRYQYDLGGGAMMDTGCYAAHLLRHLAGAEPEEVVSARPTLRSPDVDRAMEADVRFADGRTGRLRCALFSARNLVRVHAIVRGERGEMRVLNPFLPHFYHRLTISTPQGTRTEHVRGDATYLHQLRAFAAHVRDDAPIPTTPADSIANMRLIDAVYDRAGLRRRGEAIGRAA